MATKLNTSLMSGLELLAGRAGQALTSIPSSQAKRLAAGLFCAAMGLFSVGLLVTVGNVNANRHDQAVRDDLNRHGVAASVVVVEVTDRSRSDLSLGVAVRLPGSHGASESVDLGASRYAGVGAGHRLPVVFDPDHPSMIVAADQAGSDAAREGDQLVAVGTGLIILGVLALFGSIITWAVATRTPRLLSLGSDDAETKSAPE